MTAITENKILLTTKNNIAQLTNTKHEPNYYLSSERRERWQLQSNKSSSSKIPTPASCMAAAGANY